MLKKLCIGLFLALYLAGFGVSVPHASALGDGVVLFQVQTGVTGGATQEYISFVNNSSEVIDVTGWCVTKTSGADTGTPSLLGCIVSPDTQTAMMLPAGGVVTLATAEFVSVHGGFVPDLVFSADLAASAGHVRLINASQQEVDRVGWGTAVHPESTAAPVAPSPKILQRIAVSASLQDTDNNALDFVHLALDTLPARSLYEQEVQLDACMNIPNFQETLPSGYMYDVAGDCRQDVCQNLPLLQLDVPDGYAESEAFICELIPLENSPLVITELLPNSASYDTGNEFVEIYNPTSKHVSLNGYILQISPSFSKSYALPVETVIGPGEYRSFSDLQTGLVLANSSVQLRLVAPDGSVVSTTEPYVSPAEDQAWALIGNSWQYTNQPTPAAANVMSIETQQDDEQVSVLAACPVGQYRSPETNRCRLLQAVTSAATMCKVGQVRNPETNRCRSVLSTVASLIPCQPGQERNPETNRCRAADGNVLAACTEDQERNPETNRCRKKTTLSNAATAQVQDVFAPSSAGTIKWWVVGAVVLLALGYAVYEWRQDIANLVYRYRARGHIK